jgi:hypothetical protein
MLATRRHLIATTVLASMAATSVGAQATGAISSFHVPAQDHQRGAHLRQAGGRADRRLGQRGAGPPQPCRLGQDGHGEALQRMLEGTGLAARATGDSTYVIVGGAPEPTPTAYDAADAHDPIVVTGAMVAQREAVAEKRNADNTVETLHANDVGKLPDQNVAEAIKRLPGLTAANDQGEGRYVVIRHRSGSGQCHAQRHDPARARARWPSGQAGRHSQRDDPVGVGVEIAAGQPGRQCHRR